MLSPMRILLVEDDPAHAELIQRAFEDRGSEFRLTIASTLEEARAHMKDLKPTLIIADWRLPDGDSSELLPEDHNSSTPVIIMTSYGNERNAVNVMNGGLGNDIFKFNSVAAANGDTIVGFEPGDRLDLSGIDADYSAAGDQGFTLVTGAAFTAAGQLAVTYETRADGDFTIVQGNVDGNTAADFKIEIAGHQDVTAANTTL